MTGLPLPGARPGGGRGASPGGRRGASPAGQGGAAPARRRGASPGGQRGAVAAGGRDAERVRRRARGSLHAVGSERATDPDRWDRARVDPPLHVAGTEPPLHVAAPATGAALGAAPTPLDAPGARRPAPGPALRRVLAWACAVAVVAGGAIVAVQVSHGPAAPLGDPGAAVPAGRGGTGASGAPGATGEGAGGPPGAAAGAGAAGAGSWAVRLVAATQAVTDSRGDRWQPDAGAATGGTLAGDAQAIAGTGTPDLYRSARFGVRAETVAVPEPGQYAVDLGFAEIQGAAPGRRVFRVVVGQTVEAAALDVAALVGQDQPYHLLFVVPVTGTTLTVRFVPVTGQTMVSTVAVALQSASTATTTLLSQQFDGPAGSPPDAQVWQYQTGSGWGDGELERYTASTANARLDGRGDLVIEARRSGPAPGSAGPPSYTSARIDTQGSFSFRYGLVTVRAKVPAGDGLWPAVWLLGTDAGTVGWPACGEIDVMEVRGAQPSIVYSSIHGPMPDVAAGYTASAHHVSPVPLSNGFHTYTALWTPLGISVAVDGTTYETLTPQDVPATNGWPYDAPMFLIVDLAIGAYGGPVSPTTVFPADLLIEDITVTR